MSLFSSLSQVLAPYAAKLNGLLTGWDGTTYTNPGEAVRQQIADLHILIGDEPGTAIDASAIGYGEDSNVEDALDGLNGRLAQVNDAIGQEYTTQDVTVTTSLRYLLESSRISADIATSSSVSYYRCGEAPAFPGDKFKVSLNIMRSGLGHIGFLDSDRKLLSFLAEGDGTSQKITDYEFTCPDGTTYVVFNSSGSTFVIKKYSLAKAATLGYVAEEKADILGQVADIFDTYNEGKFSVETTSYAHNEQQGIPVNGPNILDALRVAANSKVLDDSAAAYRTRLYSGKFSHDAMTVVSDGKAYTAYLCNATDTGDNPGQTNAFVNLGITNLENLTLTTPTENIRVCGYGDTVEGRTVTSGAGVPNIVLNNGNLHILFSARLSDGKYYVMRRIYTISSETMSDVEICKIVVSGNEIDFSTENFSQNIAQCNTGTFLSVNGQIGYDGTNYYIGVCEHATIRTSVILTSTNLKTFSLWLIPNANISANFENSMIVFNGALYCAIRQNNRGVISLIKYKLSDKTVMDFAEIPDAEARATWFVMNNALYLAHNSLSRMRFEIVKINTSKTMALSQICYQALTQMIYPVVYESSGNFYCTATGASSMYVYIRKLAFGAYTVDNMFDMFAKIVGNYLS